MKKYMNIWYMAIMLLSMISFIDATHEVVKTEAELDALIKNNNLAVLMFYYKDDTLNEKKMGYAKYSERLLQRISLKDRYDDAGVVFIEVNIADKSMEQLKEKYTIKKYPTFFLFIDGKVVVDRSGDRVYMQDVPEEEELIDFIEKHLRTEINKVIGDEDYKYYEEDETDTDDEYYYSYPRRTYYRYYDYPYYYHPYGYRRYHWWPYYGRRYYRGHRGGFGFSFGF